MLIDHIFNKNESSEISQYWINWWTSWSHFQLQFDGCAFFQIPQNVQLSKHEIIFSTLDAQNFPRANPFRFQNNSHVFYPLQRSHLYIARSRTLVSESNLLDFVPLNSHLQHLLDFTHKDRVLFHLPSYGEFSYIKDNRGESGLLLDQQWFNFLTPNYLHLNDDASLSIKLPPHGVAMERDEGYISLNLDATEYLFKPCFENHKFTFSLFPMNDQVESVFLQQDVVTMARHFSSSAKLATGQINKTLKK